MIIKCDAQNRVDYFDVPENSLDVIKSYTDKNMPIKCLELCWRSYDNVFTKDKSEESYLYLNNYLFYKDVTDKYWIMTQDELNDIYFKQCCKCKNEDVFKCEYKRTKESNVCTYFEEKFSLRNLFKKSSK